MSGEIRMWGGSSAPAGWAICDGSSLATASYPALFAVLGYTYGGAGANFNLPDMRGRFALGKAAAGTGSTLGETGGSLDHTHTGAAHTHTIPTQAAATTGGPSSTTPTSLVVGAVADSTHTHQVPAHDHGGATGSSGTGATGSANPPFLAINYIIKT